MDCNSSGSVKFSRTPFREINRNNPREQTKKQVGRQHLKGTWVSEEKASYFQLTCSKSVPQWEEGEGYWTEMGQRMRLEERFRTYRCLRWHGNTQQAAAKIPYGVITAIVFIEL